MGELTEATNTRHRVKYPEDVGDVRRVVSKLSRDIGANEAEVGRAELTVTELATNLLRHARPDGHILVRALVTGACRGIEFLSIDTGPGMHDVRFFINRGPHKPVGLAAVPQKDADKPRPGGHASLGVGLASIERLSTHFDIYSQPDKGTVVLSRHYFGNAPKLGAIEVGAVSIARPGETVSGDAWAIAPGVSELSVLLVDGLGHGVDARRAAQAAIKVLETKYSGDVEDYVLQANAAMLPTRGGVLGIARVDPKQNGVQFVGVGDIECRLFLPGRKDILTSRDGIVGARMSPPTTRISADTWAPGTVMVLNSDGVTFKLDATIRPDLFQHDPAIIAAVIMRDGFRGTDDATVVVVKDTRKAPP